MALNIEDIANLCVQHFGIVSERKGTLGPSEIVGRLQQLRHIVLVRLADVGRPYNMLERRW